MRISRHELFDLLGVSAPLTAPISIVMENEEGTRQASIRWTEDEFSADMSECFAIDASELIFSIDGRFDPTGDTFDLTARDRDALGADEADVRVIAARFCRNCAGMQAL